jgi:hypothetical protein
MIGDFPNLGTVCLKSNLIVNILSLAEVRKVCRVTMDLRHKSNFIESFAPPVVRLKVHTSQRSLLCVINNFPKDFNLHCCVLLVSGALALPKRHLRHLCAQHVPPPHLLRQQKGHQ